MKSPSAPGNAFVLGKAPAAVSEKAPGKAPVKPPLKPKIWAPEVLAPAGSPDCLPAAVAGGADAVYLGLRHFNARGRAENFRKSDLPRHVDYLHGHGLKCYVVFNTLVHDDEHPKALDLATHAHHAGVDAVIVQDLGLWQALARELPDLERHASTQMTVHHPSQIAVLAALGARRVILARELSMAEVDTCTKAARRLGIETEHFVHGALCYAYSGQCLMSNFAGCRSANRGTCAQNCRFDYIRTDGEKIAGKSEETPAAQPDTVLSMKDLALNERVGDLADAGVASLKIEGRLKSADYVYTVSKIYRAAVDAWKAKRTPDQTQARELMKDVFSRSNSAAPLDGDWSDTARLHRYTPGRDRAPDAELVSIDRARGTAVVSAAVPPRAGQGFAFAVGMNTGGFLVTAVDPGPRPGTWKLLIRLPAAGPRLPAGLALFRNADHQRKKDAVTAMSAVPLPPPEVDTVAVDLTVTGAIGQVLAVTATTSDGRETGAASTSPLVPAAQAPLDAALLTDKLGGFGGTGFRLGELRCALQGDCFLPASALKELRREIVTALQAQPIPVAAVDPDTETPAVMGAPPEPIPVPARATNMWVAVNSLAGARAALAAGADSVWLDDATLDLWGAKPPMTLAEISAAGIPAGKLWIRHPATAPLSPHIAAMGLPVVAGHIGVIAAARAAGLPVIADVFCNVFSTATLLALGGLGAEAAVISLECSAREIARLAGRVAALHAAGTATPKLALVAGGRVPAMLTRQDHGLKAGAIGTITAVPRDGGLTYELQRRQHDTVIWEGRRLCAVETVLATRGIVDAWILELADLTPALVTEMVEAYRDLRAGEASAGEVAEVVTGAAPYGTFTGHLHQGSRELDIVEA